ncbi:MAG: serine protease [Syntrophotaleaceae bacterium]
MAIKIFIFPLLILLSGASAHAVDLCELQRVLGGEAAYRDCLEDQEGDVPFPAHQPEPVGQQPGKGATPAENSDQSGLLNPVFNGLGSRVLSAAELFEQVKPSVFVVLGARNHRDLELKKVSQGSAVAISVSRLLTNYHVVDGQMLLVIFQGDKWYPARMVWSDPETDRCILEVKDLRLRPVAGIRTYTSLKVGEKVFTVGAPYGLEHTLGEGLISGKRALEGVNIVQTSAPISPGSSGGGLFDQQGRLVGITTFLLQGAQSLNFAIAADEFPR